MYCIYMPVLHVYVCIVGIACMVCICMYLHVLYVLNILYVCVCIVCICLYILKCFCRYIHIHTHTYIHTIQTKYRFVANACMCMYFLANTYIIQTAGFTYIQIQTCRVPDVSLMAGAARWSRSMQLPGRRSGGRGCRSAGEAAARSAGTIPPGRIHGTDCQR